MTITHVTRDERDGNVTEKPDEAIIDAARWLVDQSEHVSAIIPDIKARFALTTPQAITAIRHADAMRTLRGVAG